jgi:low affinity Fe/Cu permease
MDKSAVIDRSKIFSAFARWTERQAGRSYTFAAAVLTVVVWGVSGPYFAWSDTWQLVINTGTTIVTFLMVFLIQHGQSRDTQAIQLKLDELIRVNRGARNDLLQLEELSESELAAVKGTFDQLIAARAREKDAEPERLREMIAPALPAEA